MLLRDLDPSDLTQLSRSGVTPEYVAQLQAGGLPELSTDDVIQLSSSGVKPEFVAAVTAAGIADADIDAIVGLARSGVSPEYLGDMQRQEYPTILVCCAATGSSRAAPMVADVVDRHRCSRVRRLTFLTIGCDRLAG